MCNLTRHKTVTILFCLKPQAYVWEEGQAGNQEEGVSQPLLQVILCDRQTNAKYRSISLCPKKLQWFIGKTNTQPTLQILHNLDSQV